MSDVHGAAPMMGYHYGGILTDSCRLRMPAPTRSYQSPDLVRTLTTVVVAWERESCPVAFDGLLKSNWHRCPRIGPPDNCVWPSDPRHPHRLALAKQTSRCAGPRWRSGGGCHSWRIHSIASIQDGRPVASRTQERCPPRRPLAYAQ